MKKFVVLLLLLSLTGVSSVSAHGGRLNSEGCHNDYEAKTYHCHDEAGNITSSKPLPDDKEVDMNKNEGSDDMDKNDDTYERETKVKKIEFKKVMEAQKATLKDVRDASKEEIKKMRDEARSEIETNRDAIKDNLKSFKSDNRNELKSIKAELTDEQKATLAELSKMFQEDMAALKVEFKSAANVEQRDAINVKMQELVDTHYIAMKNVIGDNTDAVALLDERHSVYEENEDLREKNRDTREEYRTERQTTVDKYRTSFIARLGNALEKISDEKLEKLVTRIDTMLASYEANTTLTEERKDKILGQLIALKELIEEHLETQDVEADVLDIINELTAQ